VSTVRQTLTRLSVHNSHLESTSQLLLSDTLYKTFAEAGVSYVWPHLQSLNLSNNVLRSTRDLGTLVPSLRHLDLSFNQLTTVFELTALPYLEHVSYVGNVITEAHDLHLSFGNLKVLDLGRNGIERLGGFSKLYSLGVLSLSCNRVESVTEVKHLAELPCLELLSLTGNPVAASLDYRVRALSYFGSRAPDVVLDNEKASLTEVDQISIIQAIDMARRTTRTNQL
jgi:Leucine-rich repeat (LRR) protein